MSLKFEVGTFASPGSTGNQTITLADANFGTVKALVLQGTFATAPEDVGANEIFCLGFGTQRGGTVQQLVHNVFSLDGGGTSATSAQPRDDSILFGQSSTTVRDFQASLDSLGDHQFVVNWSDLPGTPSIVFGYQAWGGTDLDDALVHTFAHTAGTGGMDVTVTAGFGQPDLILAFGTQAATSGLNPAAPSASNMNVTFGAGYDHRNRFSTSYGESNSAANMLLGISQSDDIYQSGSGGGTSFLNEGGLLQRATWPTDGFRVNKIVTGIADLLVGCLSLKGSFSKATGFGYCPTAAPTVTQDLPLNATPRGAFFFHGNLPAIPEGQIDTTSADLGTVGFGATDGSNQVHWAIGNDDGNTTSVGHRHYSNTMSVRMFTPSASGTLTSEASGSFSGTNVRLTWADTDTVARQYCYLLVGDRYDVPIAWTTA